MSYEKRDAAFVAWSARVLSRPNNDADYAREMFNAGWEARKRAEYAEIIAQIYEPGTPGAPGISPDDEIIKRTADVIQNGAD